MVKTIMSRDMKTLRYSLLTLSIGVLLYPVTSTALEFLVEDPAKQVQKYYENIARAAESIKTQIEKQAIISAMASFAEMGVENVNNGFANVIARLDKGEEERQNLEQLERSQPASDACATLTLTAGLNEGSCSSVTQQETLVRSRSALQTLATAGGIIKQGEEVDYQQINIANMEAARAIVEECAGLDGNCEKPDLLFSPPNRTLSAKEYRAVQIQEDIAVNPKIKVPYAAGLDRDSAAFKRAQVDDVRRENMRNEIRSAKENLLITLNGTLVDGVRKPGQVELYQRYVDDRMGSTDWICEVTNACPAGHVYAPPAEIEKRMIQLDAVMLDLSLKQYQSALRTESYLSSMQQLKVSPL